MKKHSKRGFTITELAIVIAVIAILAAVLIPTFSGIVNRGKESAALQKATAAYHAVLGVAEEGTLDNGVDAVDAYILPEGEGDGKYYFSLEKGNITLVEDNSGRTTVEAKCYASLDDVPDDATGAVYIASYSENTTVYVYTELDAE